MALVMLCGASGQPGCCGAPAHSRRRPPCCPLLLNNLCCPDSACLLPRLSYRLRSQYRLTHTSATDKSTRVRCLFFLCLSAHNSSYILRPPGWVHAAGPGATCWWWCTKGVVGSSPPLCWPKPRAPPVQRCKGVGVRSVHGATRTE